MKSQERISAGGVAFRNVNSRVDVAIIQTSKEGRWQLPKGVIDPGETSEQAAVREVREEAGITCEIVEKIDSVDYWYVDRWGKEPARIHKYVHFYLMKYISGDVADHDDEVVDVRWSEIGEAIETLAFNDEKNMVRKANDILS
jgi:8-oxo-dGTP pyrophosphatase MutT (NUDIX family)